MIVCICNQVSESRVRQAVTEGHQTVEALSSCLGVGTGCGCCLDYTRELLDSDNAAAEFDDALPVPA